MITFTWELTDHGYINWEAVWDGRLDNDELLDSQDDPTEWQWGHPLADTLDYEQQQQIHKVRAEASHPAEELESDHPKNIRKAGDYVALNPVTLALCQMLENPEAIKAASGNVHPYSYRGKLLAALSYLWD